MNQAIRDRFYSQGNKKHVEYVIRTSGMNEQEAELFRMLHNGAYDLLVESTLCIVAEVEKLKQVYQPPVEMLEKWEEAHKHYVEKAAWIKTMLAM